MAEQVIQQQPQTGANQNNIQQQNSDSSKKRKSPELQLASMAPGGITRERSFVKSNNNQQNINKRRSLAFNQQQQQVQLNNQQNNQIRGKPALEIYRPPNVRLDGNSLNKLNVHAQEFTMNRSPGDLHSPCSSILFPAPGNILQHSKSNANIQQMHLQAANRHGMSLTNMGGHRTILVSHPMQISQMGGVGVALQSSQLPLVNSPSSGNVLHQSTPHRVKFAAEAQQQHSNKMHNNINAQLHQQQHQHQQQHLGITNPLQRSKSLSSADALTRGIAGLGLALGNEATDIGTFPPEIRALIDKAMEDPNQLNARCLMELANHLMQRAVEGRRYALPISRLCLSIIAKERKETFLEALLNTCRQWYQEREKILYSIQGMKSPSRTRFTAFMAFLTEMFCQLKRRQLQLRTQCDGAPPPLVLLTLLSKCCEDCVKPPVRSLSEIECLFFVLTCIGRDLETHLPQQLEALLSSVRDAFLNSSASAPAIRRTLLQLIELQASRWQLPGNTVLYYYPSSK